jgi:hypothetical protein
MCGVGRKLRMNGFILHPTNLMGRGGGSNDPLQGNITLCFIPSRTLQLGEGGIKVIHNASPEAIITLLSSSLFRVGEEWIVDPIPYRGMSEYPYESVELDWDLEWNTRVVGDQLLEKEL